MQFGSEPLEFAREPYSDSLIEEMRPLWAKHHAEIPQLNKPLEPDLDVYKRLDSMGKLRLFTARRSGKLAGYQVCMVDAHPHSRQSRQALQDLLYLEPDARCGLAGYRFIQWCDRQLAAEGIEVSYKSIDAKHDFGRLLERMGYELVDLTYARKLEVA